MSTQRRATYISQYVWPGEPAKGFQLPGDRSYKNDRGEDIGRVYEYSLSPLSTVPFIGTNSSNKVLTWGEVLRVFPNENVTIYNRSFHAGNIVLQSEQTIVAPPKAIRLPVPLSNDVTTIVRPSFPLDVRTARRAWIVFLGMSGAFPIDVRVIGRQSFQASAPLAAFEYDRVINIPANSPLGRISLGADTSDVGAHALLDLATFEITTPGVRGTIIDDDNMMFLLEY